jgi:hypothetical protein
LATNQGVRSSNLFGRAISDKGLANASPFSFYCTILIPVDRLLQHVTLPMKFASDVRS